MKKQFFLIGLTLFLLLMGGVIEGDGHYMERFKTRGLQLAEPTPEITAEMQKVAKEGVWQKRANDQEKRKLPGKRVLVAYVRLLE